MGIVIRIIVTLVILFTFVMCIGYISLKKEEREVEGWYKRIQRNVGDLHTKIYTLYESAFEIGEEHVHKLKPLYITFEGVMGELLQRMDEFRKVWHTTHKAANVKPVVGGIDLLIAKMVAIEMAMRENVTTSDGGVDLPWKDSKYFGCCKNRDEFTKRYREYAKIYHPDNGLTGEESMFRNIKAEYDQYNKL